MRGNGSQKNARLERLKDEIIDYVRRNPSCLAADIVDHLSNERKMKSRLNRKKNRLFHSKTYENEYQLQT